MVAPQGFTFEVRKSGEVVIRHFGRPATVLRGRQAERFLAEAGDDSVDAADLQGRMARITGNYRRGNERGRQ